MKNKAPLNTFNSKIDRPGFTQADTVAHCGTLLIGQFTNTLMLTDIYSPMLPVKGEFISQRRKNNFYILEPSSGITGYVIAPIFTTIN